MRQGYYYAKIDGEERIVEKKKGLKYPYLDGFCCDYEYKLLGRVPKFEEVDKIFESEMISHLQADSYYNEILELRDTIEALKSELKEVCDVLIRKCPEMKEWVMLNWRKLYDEN